MRAVGIVSSLGEPPGLYARDDTKTQETLVKSWDSYLQVSKAASLTGEDAAVAGGAAAAAGAVAAGVAALGFWPVAVAFMPAMGAALAARYLYQRFGGDPPPAIVRVNGAPMPTAATSSVILPDRGLMIPAAGLLGQFQDYDSPVFHGLFDSAATLESVMKANGGHSELLIIDQKTANRLYRSTGGGRFSCGLHLPHPKDPSILAEAGDFSARMKSELEHEWVEMFEALGAKHIVIADATEASGRAKAKVANLAAGEIGAKFRGAYGNSRVEEYNYHRGTFDVERALAGRLWYGHVPEIKAVVEGRVGGNQSSFRKTITVDASFGASAEFLAMQAATKGEGSLSGKHKRTYDFFAEFFPK